MSAQKQIRWKPLETHKLQEIKQSFALMFPAAEFGDMARQIGDYWIDRLKRVWKEKPRNITNRDELYRPADPLSRIEQKTVVIAYADSVGQKGQKTLTTLDTFLKQYFPAVRGLHMLPACVVAQDRFNDGYFSQVVRDLIHKPFGTNQQFAQMMSEYYSMADFVLNHVDIDNPVFQDFLNGDDAAADCFYVFSEKEYQTRRSRGDFDLIFRPRPFPLFTIFRRKPQETEYAGCSHQQKVDAVNRQFQHRQLGRLPDEIIGLLSIFNQIKNDQMLLAQDYQHITAFRNYLTRNTSIDPDVIFDVSSTQETFLTPYVFNSNVQNHAQLLQANGLSGNLAAKYARIYAKFDPVIFGREVRALTTFSHVQVDLNTSTSAGLKMLIDDFAWYLGLDLNMLRLDAANYAFKKWNTSCFGLDEVKILMQILYLSMDCVSPRMVANLEVNDMLSCILAQMADKKAPPPMMYDFHLPGMLPVVFNRQNTGILERIFELIGRYDVPKQSIRFSLAESHDGKSVRGSLDLLSLAERQSLVDTIQARGGKIKYKSVPKGECPLDEFEEVCRESGLDSNRAKQELFNRTETPHTVLRLKNTLEHEADIFRTLNVEPDKAGSNAALKYFLTKIIRAKEPYELCTATRDCLFDLDSGDLEEKRYLAFHTLAFALMGRNVKAIYFNDLLGFPNDFDRFKQSGELRDLKRTKSDFDDLAQRLRDSKTFEGRIFKAINNLIALVDSDPALHFRGNEARWVRKPNTPHPDSAAVIYNTCADHHTLVVVNAADAKSFLTIDLRTCRLHTYPALFDNIDRRWFRADSHAKLDLSLQPYQRLWLTPVEVVIPSDLLITD